MLHQHQNHLHALDAQYQYAEHERSPTLSVGSGEALISDTKGMKEVAYIDLTDHGERASEEPPVVDVFVYDEHSSRNILMDISEEISAPLPNGEVEGKNVPPVDVIVEGDIKKDEGQCKADTTRPKTQQEDPVPELTKTAENGWILTLQNPELPYDQESDPAGLYGGREVDDRPSLLDFYHQDARTNGHFAKMAPTEADLMAEIAETKNAKRLEKAQLEADAIATKLEHERIKAWEASALAIGHPILPSQGRTLMGKPGILKLRNGNGEVFSPPERSSANVLAERIQKSVPSKSDKIFPLRPAAQVSFSSTTKEQKRKKNSLHLFNEAQQGYEDIVLEEDDSDSDNGAPLHRMNDIDTWLRKNENRTWTPDPNDKSKRNLHIDRTDSEDDTNAHGEPDFEMPSIESDNEADVCNHETFGNTTFGMADYMLDEDAALKEAIALSLLPDEQETTGKGKQTEERKENLNRDMRTAANPSKASEAKRKNNFFSQFKEVEEADTAMKMPMENADSNAFIGASTWHDREQADFEQARAESMMSSPDKKRKSSSQSVADDGADQDAEKHRAGRGWTSPEGSENRAYKRCKVSPHQDVSVGAPNPDAVSSPEKPARI